MTRIASGVTDQYVYFVAVDATDLKTRETGLTTWTVYRSRNGAAAAAMTTPTINETDSVNMPGVYELLLDEDMTIDAGDETQEMVFHITHSGMAPVTRVIELYRPKITAGETLAVSSGAVTTVTTLTGHTAQSGDSFARIGATGSGLTSLASQASVDTLDNFVDTEIADIQARLPAALVGGRMDANVGAISSDSTAADNAEAFFDGTGYAGTGNTIPTVTTVNGLAANVITAAATATDFGTEIFNAVVTSQLTESYAADNAAPTVAQALFLIQQMLTEKSVSSTTLTVKKLDGSTTAATFTLNDATNPTSITRAT